VDSNNIICSFCGVSQDKTNFLVEGDNAFICDICITKAQEALTTNKTKENSEISILKPQEIKEQLDYFIIGQDKAKVTLSVAVYNHYKRVLFGNDDMLIDKSNILLVGPTGTGKTLLAKTLARILNIPFAIVDATVLTEAGYVGEDVENVLVRLYQESGYDVTKTQQGIIYIDEIDKIARKNSNPSITRDVSGEGVQQSLLKIIEGTIASIPPEGGRKHPEQPLVKIDTTNILFICGGTFDGIDNVIERRIKGGGIGFDRKIHAVQNSYSNLQNIQIEDIIKYGFLPELIGRLPVLSHLNYLDENTLYSILVEPANSIIKQYKNLFKLDNVELHFQESALRAIASLAIKRKIGARALRTIIEEIMIDIMYTVPSKKNIKTCTITKEVVQNHATPKLTYYKKTA
tara:strand:- start:652 stop:1860 length:1209 start_codon:yes stop_codon:yes gene_type:complete